MTPGSIVEYKQFKFYDGAQADKLLIVLNAGGGKPYLVIKTTSQPRQGRKANEGCHAAEGYYFLPAKRDNFRKETWVLLYEYYELSAAEFLKAHFTGAARITGTLREETLRAIINCARKSQDWSAHYDTLF